MTIRQATEKYLEGYQQDIETLKKYLYRFDADKREVIDSAIIDLQDKCELLKLLLQYKDSE